MCIYFVLLGGKLNMANTTLDTLEGLSRKITIEVSKERVSEELDIAYKEAQKAADMPGFRKGKVPISKVKSTYKEKVEQQVIQALVSEAYQAALDEHSQIPIDYPMIDFKNFKEDEAFKFTAEFEVRPEVKLTKLDGLKVQKEKLDIDLTEIDKVLENMQNQMTETIPVLEERAAQQGDISIVDFVGTVDGLPLEGGTAKDFQLELGSNSFIPGFEEGIVGMKIGGTTDLKLKFPDDYHAADIAGKDVLFSVKLNSLLKKTLPELNDDFAQKIGEEFKTLQQLKDRILDDMKEGEGKRVKDDLKNRILKALIKENPVEVPKSLLKEQKDKLVEDMQNRMKQQGMTEDQYDEYKSKWDADFADTASFMIQSSFLIDALAQKLDIKASEEDIDAKLAEHATQSGMDLEQLKEFYNTPDKRAQLSYQITEDRAVQHLIDNAKVEEVDKEKLKDEKK